MNDSVIEIIQPDDWHPHLRDGQLLNAVVEHSSRIFKRCVVMPNLSKPITNLSMAKQYKSQINIASIEQHSCNSELFALWFEKL